MVVQAPPPPGVDDAIEDGVIEDARRRQQRHRQIGALLLSLIAASALIVGLVAGGGGGAGSGGGMPMASPSGGFGGTGGAHAGANEFPGAPVTQVGGYGVSTDYCPLATANRYLPARSGCITVRRADVDGDGRPDLIIVYSTLSHRRAPSFDAEPASQRHDFGAKAAFLEVVFAGGTTVTTQIRATALAHVAAIDAVAHVNDDPGDEIFLEVQRISSGATGLAYGYHAGRLVAAGVDLSYGGDSASASGFDCEAGRPPRVIQHAYRLIGPTIYAWWKETETVLAWRGPRLVGVNSRSFKEHGAPKGTDLGIGRGCTRGIA
jgi:hypothetical protein